MIDLYRFFDNDGALLYVGISLSAAQRASQHKHEKQWWPDVARMDVERHPNRAAALDAERHAITTERPIYNIVHNKQGGQRPAEASVVALLLSNGRCPIGLIKHANDRYVTLSLYSFFTGDFGHKSQIVPVDDILHTATATIDRRDPDGTVVYDMDHLADVQTFWQAA